MKVAIAGSSGLLGTELVRVLRTGEHEVVRLVRRPPTAPDERLWDPSGHTVPDLDLSDVDAAVVLSGSPVNGRPWTSEYRRQILTSRVESTRTVARALAAGAGDEAGPRTLLVPSAVGVYGAARGDEVLAEDAWVADDFLARVCRLTEQVAERTAAPSGVRVVSMRTGIVLSHAGGYLGVQRRVFGACLGGPVDSGEGWLPWITRADHVRAMVHLLTSSDLEGPVNLVAPGVVRQGEFARAYAALLHRPSCVRLPTWALVPVLGPDMVDELLRTDQRVVPDALLRDGFLFAQPTLTGAMRWLDEGEPASRD